MTMGWNRFNFDQGCSCRQGSGGNLKKYRHVNSENQTNLSFANSKPIMFSNFNLECMFFTLFIFVKVWVVGQTALAANLIMARNASRGAALEAERSGSRRKSIICLLAQPNLRETTH